MAIVNFFKANKKSYWWERSDLIWLDTNEIQSVEQMTDRTPGGSEANAYVRIVMKNGTEHKIYEDVYYVAKKLGYA